MATTNNNNNNNNNNNSRYDDIVIAVDQSRIAPFSAKGFSHGLVFFSDPNPNSKKQNEVTGIAVACKTKNSDLNGIVKSFTRLWLENEKELKNFRAIDCIAASKREEIGNKLKKCLSKKYVGVCDKNGNLLPGSIRDAGQYGERNLRKILIVNSSKPIYKLVVNDGLGWDNPAVQKALRDWIDSANIALKYYGVWGKVVDIVNKVTAKEEKSASKASKDSKASKESKVA